jgi:hypothetical protein
MNFKVLDELLPTCYLRMERNMWHGRENTNQQSSVSYEGGQDSKVGRVAYGPGVTAHGENRFWKMLTEVSNNYPVHKIIHQQSWASS